MWVRARMPGPFEIHDLLMFGCDIYLNMALIIHMHHITIFMHAFNFQLLDIEIPINKEYNIKRIFHLGITKIWEEKEYLNIYLNLFYKEIFNKDYYIFKTKYGSKNI